MMFSVRSAPFDGAHIACDYHIARLLAVILEQTQGRRLAEEDRMLWKMGVSVADRTRISPSFTAFRSSDGTIDRWSFNPGRLWFPRDRRLYARLWKSMSGGVSYSVLLSRHEEDPTALEGAMENLQRVFESVLADGQPRRLPPVPVRSLLMPGWLSRLADEKDIRTIVECCLEGVPVEDIIA